MRHLTKLDCRAGIRAALTVLSLCLLCPAAWTSAAQAEELRVSGSSDPGLPQAQARQQALERALAEAVFRQAKALLPGPVAEARLAALRAQLAPHSIVFVQSYTELAKQPVAQDQEQAKPQTAPTVDLELSVEILRPALRTALVRYGFFAGTHHPGTVAVVLGPGVKAKDAQSLEALDLLLGLSRSAQAKTTVSLERLPQGYYKAVLRQGPVAVAADATELSALWLDIWGKFFSDRQQQAGPGLRSFSVSGFASADAVFEFLKALSSWDDAVQEASLAGMDLDGDKVSARFACRVTSQVKLEAHLREALASFKLKLSDQAGGQTP